MSSIKMKATTINATMMRKFCFPPDRLIISFVFCVTKSNRCVVLSKSFSISSSILLIRKSEKRNKSPSHCVSRKGKQGQGKFKNKKLSLGGMAIYLNFHQHAHPGASHLLILMAEFFRNPQRKSTQAVGAFTEHIQTFILLF